MNATILSLGLLQVVLPLALIIANTVVPSGSAMGLVLRTSALWLLMIYASLAGIWLFPPWWTPYAFMILLGLGAFYRGGRPRTGHRLLVSGEAGFVVAGMLGAIMVLTPVFQGRTAPSGAVDLAMPLGPGRYLVTSGGTTGAINGHLATLTLERARAFRGQSYAVDIIGIDRAGLRASGISPVDPAAYLIYGTPVLAPCDGVAAMVIDGVADMPVPQMDRANMTGNSVMMDCGSHFVLLAHLAPESIVVSQGQPVAVGQQIGRVGNSGNTGEPHLHVHVQDKLPAIDPISAAPLWFKVEGRFLIRNDRFIVSE